MNTNPITAGAGVDHAVVDQAEVDLADVQGLLRFGYKHHTQACFLLLRVQEPEAARAWLATVPVSSAVAVEPTPPTAVQVALSSAGLRALGVPEDIIAAYSPEFVAGMGQEPSRSRRLGDVGASATALWQWGGEENAQPHVLVLLYALPGQLPTLQQAIEAQCATGFTLLAALPTVDLNGIEPFGFVDGLSQPKLDWARERPARDQEQAAYTNLSCLGEYLLGYPNEYGGYTDRPLLAPQRDPQALLPRAEDVPTQADLGRNGSYLVLRQLQQDVAGFWRYLDHQAGGDTAQREHLAAAMLGRQRDGTPLVATDRREGSAPELNAFTYDADPHGRRCPLGAHVRRANPRNGDLPPGSSGLLSWLKRTLGFDAQALAQDRVASTRFHRLLRRGRAYSSAYAGPAAAGANANAEADTGLYFICLGANIARQFEFVQGAWLAGTHFDGLSNESDPLLGARQPAPDGAATDTYAMPQANGPDQRLEGLPPFVTVLGGAYFFLPGIRALRYLATVR
jgi:Dyp-type peroxidase family